MPRVLMLSSVASMIDQFNMANIGILRQLGYDVHVAANFIRGNTSSTERLRQFIAELERQDIPHHHVDLSRKAADLWSNLRAFRQVMVLLRQNDYEFLHCHSPIGGVCGRIAGHLTRTPVIYTAHGFHFYRGAPWFNWLVYYPVERLLANCTEVLITINHEDFERAKRFGAKSVVHIPGVGVDTAKLTRSVRDRDRVRDELGIASGTFVLLSVGELTANKNHATVLKALAALEPDGIEYLLCGRGELEGWLKENARKLGLGDRVRFLGFRNDVAELLAASDAFVFPSLREGLSVALMEALAAGLPIICSRIRGNTDLIEDGKGGFLVAPHDVACFADRIGQLRDSLELRERMSAHNLREAEEHDVNVVNAVMRKVYAQVGSHHRLGGPQPGTRPGEQG